MEQTIKDLAKAYVAIEKQQVGAKHLIETYQNMKLDIIKAAKAIEPNQEILFAEIAKEYRA